MNNNGQNSAPPAQMNPRAYRITGRAAVRAFLARACGDDSVASASRLVLRRSVASEIVRLWALDDLFLDSAVEQAARTAYPELEPEFRALDEDRERSRQVLQLVLVRRDVDAAMLGMEWPEAAA